MDPLNVQRNGYSLADVAEVMNQMTELKTTHGEPGYLAPFQQFLRSKGLTQQSWADVYNDWNGEMQADAGLASKFHGYMAQVRNRQMISKQPNVSGESMEGVSLESYAKISAQIQTGAVVEQLIAAEGISMDQWLRGQAAWGTKMSQCSPTDPIILQFGQLYQKWSPNLQASIEASTERILSDAADREGKGGGMSKELTMDNAAEFFDHKDVRVRARGAREMIRIWELSWNDRNPQMKQLTQRAFDEAVRILNDGPGNDRPGLTSLQGPVDAVEIHAWSAMADQEDAQQGTSDLVYRPLKDLANEAFMTPQQNETAQNAVRKAIARLQPREKMAQQAFAGATDELKRVQLRSLVDDYRETLSDMAEALEDWSYTAPEDSQDAPSSSSSSSSAQTSSPSTALAKPQDDGGFLAILKSLPIIGPILRALGL